MEITHSEGLKVQFPVVRVCLLVTGHATSNKYSHLQNERYLLYWPQGYCKNSIVTANYKDLYFSDNKVTFSFLSMS